MRHVITQISTETLPHSGSPLAASLLDGFQQRALGRGTAVPGVAGQFRQAKLRLPPGQTRAKVIHPDHGRLTVSL